MKDIEKIRDGTFDSHGCVQQISLEWLLASSSTISLSIHHRPLPLCNGTLSGDGPKAIKIDWEGRMKQVIIFTPLC